MPSEEASSEVPQQGETTAAAPEGEQPQPEQTGNQNAEVNPENGSPEAGQKEPEEKTPEQGGTDTAGENKGGDLSGVGKSIDINHIISYYERKFRKVEVKLKIVAHILLLRRKIRSRKMSLFRAILPDNLIKK